MNTLQAVFLDHLRDSSLQLSLVLGTALLLGFRLRARPSKRCMALLLLPLPLLGLSLFWPWLSRLGEIYVPLLMVIMLVDGFLLSVSPDQFRFQRMVNRKLSIGQQNSVRVVVDNLSPHTVKGQLTDSIPAGFSEQSPNIPAHHAQPIHIAPFGSQIVEYQVKPTRRGRYRFESVSLQYQSRLGLLWINRLGGRPTELQVVPDMRRIRRLRLMASRAINTGQLPRHILGLEGTQFSGLRYYLSGDDVRKMAWQATARLDLPVVRTFQPEVDQPVLVMLDAGRRMREQSGSSGLSKYDWALSASLSFMAVALDRGDSVGAEIFDGARTHGIPLGRGKAHLNRLLENLGETEPQPLEPDYESALRQCARRLKRRALVILFTDLTDESTLENLARGLQGFSAGHSLFVVTFEDPALETLLESFPENAFEAHRKGSVLDFQRFRSQALKSLAKNRGITVISALPEQLDETLLAQYLAFRKRAR